MRYEEVNAAMINSVTFGEEGKGLFGHPSEIRNVKMLFTAFNFSRKSLKLTLSVIMTQSNHGL